MAERGFWWIGFLFLFIIFAIIVLDIALFISLVRPGDERRQMIAGKASLWSFIGLVGCFALRFAENLIRTRRKEQGISQEELAKRCEVTRQTVNAIENNKYDPTLALAFRLAKELGTTVDELFLYR